MPVLISAGSSPLVVYWRSAAESVDISACSLRIALRGPLQNSLPPSYSYRICAKHPRPRREGVNIERTQTRCGRRQEACHRAHRACGPEDIRQQGQAAFQDWDELAQPIVWQKPSVAWIPLCECTAPVRRTRVATNPSRGLALSLSVCLPVCSVGPRSIASPPLLARPSCRTWRHTTRRRQSPPLPS